MCVLRASDTFKVTRARICVERRLTDALRLGCGTRSRRGGLSNWAFCALRVTDGWLESANATSLTANTADDFKAGIALATTRSIGGCGADEAWLAEAVFDRCGGVI